MSISVIPSQCPVNLLRRLDQAGHQPLVNVQQPLVFAQIPCVVALVQHAPDFRPQAQRVRQHLKDDVALAGAITLPPQRGQAQRVRGVVGQVETALQRQSEVGRIVQARAAGAKQAGGFGCVRRLGLQTCLACSG